MSWLSNLGNTVEGWLGMKKPKESMTTTTPESLKTPQQFAQPINDYKTRTQNALQGNFKKGGHVKKTGIYRLHKGEFVLNKKRAMANKMDK
jgi:hypothetical protein